MKTESHSINDVLAKNATSFFIPPFQRAYAWGKPEIERYFSDVIRIIKSELDVAEHDKSEHFFGTVVIKEEKSGFANKSIVVDGQQRLTTTLIFLIALRDSESDGIKQDLIQQNYLTNNTSTFQDKIKLKQVTKDWQAFRALINKTKPDHGIINNAYQLFSKMINRQKNISPEINLDHYLIAIQRMNVAVIFLDERPFKGEDPQIIFETLNSLGKPLTLSDLVRNFVLLNMDSTKQSEVYEKTWHPKIEAILQENTSSFFRDYLQYKTISSVKVVSDNNTKEIYQLFKNYVNSVFNTHVEFINDIVSYVNWYKIILTGSSLTSLSKDKLKNSEIIELLNNIFHDIKAEAFKPFVLGLLEYHQCAQRSVKLNDDLFISILQSIRTYLIRRRVLSLTQGENKSIVLLCNHIEDLANGNLTMFNLLTNQSYRLRLPNDREIEKELQNMNFYIGLKKYSKFILGKIEEHNTKVAVDFRNPKITIEHIMPQNLTDDWKEELGADYDNIHKTYLHNIGNLILTEFNSEIGNKAFSIKKERIKTSSLNYRLQIINKDRWNENSMKEHQGNMISWMLNTFELPEDLRKNENYNTKIIESKEFSPLEDDAGDIAEGKKPIEINIENDLIKVSTWQDVFIEFVKYIKDNKDYDFEILLDNQVSLFKREDALIRWTEFEKILEGNMDLSKRYKTFEGKFWDKLTKIADDMFFIHINISASDCINRIVNIMNKFNMSENTVMIILK